MAELTAEMIQRGPGADPELARRKRANVQQLRSVRERLTSSSGLQRAFDRELLRMFARQRSSAALTMLLLAGVLAVLGGNWIAPAPAFIWLSIMCATMTVSLMLGRRFLETDEQDVDIRVWRRRFVLAELLQGVSWAIFIGLLYGAPDPAARIFVFFVVLVVSAATAMVSTSIANVILAGIGPMALITIARCYPFTAVSDLGLAVACLAGQGYFVLLAHRQYASTVLGLEYQSEKDALIAELEQAKANSDEARRRAEESNIAKSQFLATMSHELRTPLNAILGFSEVIKNELFGPMQVPAYKEYIQDIHASGQHLLNLINEILDLSRVEAGRYELKEEPVDLASLVEDCQHMLNLRARARSINVRVSAEPNLPKVWADERAMRQATLNLLSNAIKFTPQGGDVELKVGWTASGGQYLSVRDNGPGIPTDEIPIVMSSFGRGSSALKSAEQGSGLGLPIVKGLVDLHGGTFTLRSKLREGTEVLITLPPQRVMDALAPVTENRASRRAA
ncbi:HAMP domain-containing sensor histidine kinase [Terrarubrum flagellatum]|uniref:sensor histidine kinase n=1 Tax=Terrirubrum flagellatum TaxID=2895980 RepID=UPI003144D5BB